MKESRNYESNVLVNITSSLSKLYMLGFGMYATSNSQSSLFADVSAIPCTLLQS